MRKTHTMLLPAMLITFALLLAACGGVPEAVESAPEPVVGLDGEWMRDDTAPYAYAQAMRNRLDPALSSAFGYGEVHYKVLDTMQTYDVRYALQNAPEGEAFYHALKEVFAEAFDFHLFEDHESAASYFEWNDEFPENMSVAMDIEGSTHYWLVNWDGTFLIFTTL